MTHQVCDSLKNIDIQHENSSVGRLAPPATTQALSIARFSLAAGHGTGRASAGARRCWSPAAEVKSGWMVAHWAVRANSVIYLPAGDEHEIRAAAAQGLEFFAITAPAFSPDDYVQLPP